MEIMSRKVNQELGITPFSQIKQNKICAQKSRLRREMNIGFLIHNSAVRSWPTGRARRYTLMPRDGFTKATYFYAARVHSGMLKASVGCLSVCMSVPSEEFNRI